MRPLNGLEKEKEERRDSAFGNSIYHGGAVFDSQPRFFDPSCAMASASTGIPRWLAVSLLLSIATIFASNHVAARLAFDHGTNVLTAVTFRSIGTALVVWALMRATGVAVSLHGAKRWHALVFGLVIAVQSVCLYAAVARLPVALALLTFNTFPIMLAVITWLSGGEPPVRRVRIAMPIALVGLALALGVVQTGAYAFDARFLSGVGFALAASISFSTTWLMTERWFKQVDGRMRSFVGMAVVGVVALAVGLATDGFAMPRDTAGWTGLLLLTLFYGTAITSLFVLLPKLGMVNNAALMNFEPIAALFLGWLILGQVVQPVQIVGALVVIGAIVMVATAKR